MYITNEIKLNADVSIKVHSHFFLQDINATPILVVLPILHLDYLYRQGDLRLRLHNVREQVNTAEIKTKHTTQNTSIMMSYMIENK